MSDEFKRTAAYILLVAVTVLASWYFADQIRDASATEIAASNDYTERICILIEQDITATTEVEAELLCARGKPDDPTTD